MINIKKGTAHSLQQSDIRGTYNTGVTAGMVVHVDANGVVQVGGTNNANSDGTNGVRGFAINNSTDGDAIESNKIAVYTFDGNSIIETDQVENAVTLANYPLGTPVYSKGATGVVTTTSTNNGPIIGWVEGVRNLQACLGVTQSAQSYPSVDSSGNLTTKTYAFKAQVNIPVLSIKLAATV